MKNLLLCISLLLSIQVSAEERRDPWEGFNRKIFAFNDGADRFVLKPVAKGYKKVFPNVIRKGIGRFFNNLRYPGVALNQFLQGKGKLGVRDSTRFVINSTLGIGGIFDPARKMGFAEHEEDFGQTFAVWGISSGPYLVVPLWGPSTIRGGTGDLADWTVYPVRYLDSKKLRYALVGVNAIDTRAGLLSAENFISGDRYEFFRDAYLQRRNYLIHDGEVEDPFLDEDWEEPE